MAEKIKADDEPSIEEILDSIRQIISEDDGAEIDVEETPEVQSNSSIDDMFASDPIEEPEPNEAEEANDVFELTDIVEPEEVISVAEIVKEPEPPVAEPEIVVDLIDEAEEVVPEPVIEKPDMKQEAPVAPKRESIVEDMEDSILTEAAETAAFSAITELARKTAVEHNGVTLEDIVRTELKPMLRGWLDKNLPIVIERLVREELERVSKRVLED